MCTFSTDEHCSGDIALEDQRPSKTQITKSQLVCNKFLTSSSEKSNLWIMIELTWLFDSK